MKKTSRKLASWRSMFVVLLIVGVIFAAVPLDSAFARCSVLRITSNGDDSQKLEADYVIQAE